MSLEILQPAGWARPKGYSNGIVARGRQVFIAGQIGWGADGGFQATRLAPQVRQALDNVVAVLAEAGGRPEHLVRLTWYVTEPRRVLLGAARRSALPTARVIGRHYPAMSVVQVVALMEAAAKVEIEATAVSTGRA